MKNHIHILFIVSAFANIGLSICGCGFSLCEEDQCEDKKMWCEGNNVMRCVREEYDNICNAESRVDDTCTSGKCVEFQWPGKLQEAGCLIPDQKCTEEGVEYVCDGPNILTCTPKGGVVKGIDCTKSLWLWDENDPLEEGLAPTCVMSNVYHSLYCALSKDLCNYGDSKCVKTASGKSMPVVCNSLGLWDYDTNSCSIQMINEGFPWTCTFSSQKEQYICVYSSDACTEDESMCVISPTTGKTARLTCYDGLWTDAWLCECGTLSDGTSGCVL